MTVIQPDRTNRFARSLFGLALLVGVIHLPATVGSETHYVPTSRSEADEFIRWYEQRLAPESLQATLDTLLEAEGVGGKWAAEMETGINATPTVDSEVLIHSVLCKESLCRVTVSVPPPKSTVHFARALNAQSVATRPPPTTGRGWGPFQHVDGRKLFTMYLFRDITDPHAAYVAAIQKLLGPYPGPDWWKKEE